MDTMEINFKHPITTENFRATRSLERGQNFSLERFDRGENCWVYCGDVTPHTPAPVRDALCVACGLDCYLSSFTREQMRQVIGTRSL